MPHTCALSQALVRAPAMARAPRARYGWTPRRCLPTAHSHRWCAPRRRGHSRLVSTGGPNPGPDPGPTLTLTLTLTLALTLTLTLGLTLALALALALALTLALTLTLTRRVLGAR